MKAYRLTAPQKAELVDIQIPTPGPGEVLVKVGASGACHSDLHLMEAPAGQSFPEAFTLGHEIAGWVEELGPGVTGFRTGEAVAIYGIMGCGSCSACLRGEDNACRTVPLGGIGLGRDGGMAEFVAVPARQLFPIGKLDVAQAAPLTDAGLTPYHAVQASRETLRPGSWCVVIGIGGLGHMALQILRATTAARVIAVDSNDSALKFASELGAEVAVKSGPQAAAQIRKLVGPAPGGADTVLDFVGVQPTLDLGASVVATGGCLTLVGLGGGTVKVRPTAVGSTGVPMETRVTIPFWGNRHEMRELIALAQSGKIKAHVEKFALADSEAAYEKLHDGNVRGRAVVMPGMR